METRTNRWKEYREDAQNKYLTENQRDLIAMYFAKESLYNLPDNVDDSIELVIRRFKVVRQIICELEMKEDK